MNGANGGGPLHVIESTYSGFGFRVDRTRRFPPTFEFLFVDVGSFTASPAFVDGAVTGLFISTPSWMSASDPASVVS